MQKRKLRDLEVSAIGVGCMGFLTLERTRAFMERCKQETWRVRACFLPEDIFYASIVDALPSTIPPSKDLFSLVAT